MKPRTQVKMNRANKSNEEYKQWLFKFVLKPKGRRGKLENLTPQLQELMDQEMLKWQRLRNTAIKKVKHLIVANDLLQNLSPSMQPSSIEWLLYDQILVHECIPIVNSKYLGATCLRDLVHLVEEYQVEVLTGSDLIEAWIKLTLQYNRRGRRCSTMFLQMRWYQLKKLSRQYAIKPRQNLAKKKRNFLVDIATKYEKIKKLPKWSTLKAHGTVVSLQELIPVLADKIISTKAKDRKYISHPIIDYPYINTVSKNFTEAFFSLMRNKELLKTCKPLKVDLDKQFEDKLINGTMYLEPSELKTAKATVVGNKISQEGPTKRSSNSDISEEGNQLKENTSAFFKLQRNKELLKICKPLRIDLYRTHENTLINGSTYLNRKEFINTKQTKFGNNNNNTEIQTFTSSKSDKLKNKTHFKKNTVTFLDLTENEELFKKRKPNTIELDKSLEVNVVDGTVHLNQNNNENRQKPELTKKDLCRTM